MGRAKIKENLGEGHYLVALDIDVTYAKKVYDEHKAYLAEFQPKLDEAKQERDDLKQAYDDAGIEIRDYLAPLQEASEAAYAEMTAAYEAWLFAVENQPDPEIIEPLREAMNYWFDGFTTTHNDYILALDGDPQAELPVPDALESRTHALQQLTLAMGDWLGSIGALIDPAAVNAAFDALGIALDDFEAATVAYVTEPGNATLKSAMNYYQGVYETAHSDWIKAVDDNSGDELVQVAKKEYDAKTEAFQVAQKAMSATLNDGSMPPGLSERFQTMQEAEQRWRTADLKYRQMLLVKTERVNQLGVLRGRLMNFYAIDGEGVISDPIDQPANAWCADATEDLPIGTTVATIEIPGERMEAIKVRPGHESRYTYSAARDGILQPTWASSPEATFYNWAIHPGGQKWNPNYRKAKILEVNKDTNKAKIRLEAQKNSEMSKAPDGRTLDLNSPYKASIDESGEQQLTFPSPNITLEEGFTIISDVPIEYMECNGGAFEVDDMAIVEFINRKWETPKVIGFWENPKPCITSGIVCSALVMGAEEQVQYRGKPGADYDHSDYKFIHTSNATGGNVDWYSTDKGTVLTWHGPIGRSLTTRFWHSDYDYDADAYQSFIGQPGVNLFQDWQIYETRYDIPASPEMNVPTGFPANAKGAFYFLVKFKEWIYKAGKFFARAPTNHLVLGAGISESVIEEDGPDKGKTVKYLLAATTYDPWGKFPLTDYPECTTLHVYAVNISEPIADPNNPEWQLVGKQDLSGKFRLPASHIVAFSGDGKKLATLWPKFRFPKYWEIYMNGVIGPTSLQDEHTIVTGAINHHGHDLSVTFTTDEQSATAWADGTPPKKDAIIGIDFRGNDEVRLRAEYTRVHSAPDINLSLKLSDSSGQVYFDNHQNVSIDYVGQQRNMTGNSSVDMPIFIDIRNREILRLHYDVEEDVKITLVDFSPDDIRVRYVSTDMKLMDASGRVYFSASYSITDTESFQRDSGFDYAETIFNSHGPLTLYGGTGTPSVGEHVAALAFEICAPLFWQPSVDNNSVENDLDSYDYGEVYTPIKTRGGFEKAITDTQGNVIFNVNVPIGISVPIITSDNRFIWGYSPWFAYPMEDVNGNNLVAYPNVRAATKSNLEIDWAKHRTDQHKTPVGEDPPEEPFVNAVLTPICLI